LIVIPKSSIAVAEEEAETEKDNVTKLSYTREPYFSQESQIKIEKFINLAAIQTTNTIRNINNSDKFKY